MLVEPDLEQRMSWIDWEGLAYLVPSRWRWTVGVSQSSVAVGEGVEISLAK
jgi:hypothetical protein